MTLQQQHAKCGRSQFLVKLNSRRLHARTLPNQQTEAKIGCNVLNRMASLGMPISIRIK